MEISLADFLDQWGDVLKAQVIRTMDPVYTPRNEDEWDKRARERLADLKRVPFAAQVKKGILPVARSFYREDHKAAFLVGEMGVAVDDGHGVLSLRANAWRRLRLRRFEPRARRAKVRPRQGGAGCRGCPKKTASCDRSVAGHDERSFGRRIRGPCTANKTPPSPGVATPGLKTSSIGATPGLAQAVRGCSLRGIQYHDRPRSVQR